MKINLSIVFLSASLLFVSCATGKIEKHRNSIRLNDSLTEKQLSSESYIFIRLYDVVYDKALRPGNFLRRPIRFFGSVPDGTAYVHSAISTYLDDDTFNNKVFNVQDSVSFEASPAVISSIIKTSDIIKVDPRKDALVFYVDGTDVYVKDTIDKKKAPNFVYKIGHLAQDPGYAIQVSIFREKFIQMMDKTDETFKIILGRKMLDDTKYDVDRILFDSLTTPTKVVISRINEG